jgi:hypothetical protein
MLIKTPHQHDKRRRLLRTTIAEAIRINSCESQRVGYEIFYEGKLIGTSD